MMYSFETIRNKLVFTFVRSLLAFFTVVSLIFTSNLSFSASGNVSFSGYVRPNSNSVTKTFPQPIYSFSNKVALPIFPSASKTSNEGNIRVFMGNARSGNVGEQVQFDTISFNGANSVRQQAVVIDMPDSKQAVFVCYGKAKTITRGCVQFTAVKVK